MYSISICSRQMDFLESCQTIPPAAYVTPLPKKKLPLRSFSVSLADHRAIRSQLFPIICRLLHFNLHPLFNPSRRASPNPVSPEPPSSPVRNLMIFQVLHSQMVDALDEVVSPCKFDDHVVNFCDPLMLQIDQKNVHDPIQPLNEPIPV